MKTAVDLYARLEKACTYRTKLKTHNKQTVHVQCKNIIQRSADDRMPEMRSHTCTYSISPTERGNGGAGGNH